MRCPKCMRSYKGKRSKNFILVNGMCGTCKNNRLYPKYTKSNAVNSSIED